MSADLLARLGLTWEDAVLTVITAAGVYASIIAFSRVFGQRQFSNSSSYDLAFTFALGSLVGRVVLVRTTLLAAVLGLAVMFVLHAVTGWLHHNISVIHDAIQNSPVLVVANGTVLEDNLRRAKTSHLELNQQLRLSGVGSLESVAAAVLERNGSISVVRTGTPVDDAFFAEVRGRAHLRRPA